MRSLFLRELLLIDSYVSFQKVFVDTQFKFSFFFFFANGKIIYVHLHLAFFIQPVFWRHFISIYTEKFTYFFMNNFFSPSSKGMLIDYRERRKEGEKDERRKKKGEEEDRVKREREGAGETETTTSIVSTHQQPFGSTSSACLLEQGACVEGICIQSLNNYC